MAPTDWDAPFWVSDEVYTHFIDKLQSAPDKEPESEEPQAHSNTTTEHTNLVHRSINNEGKAKGVPPFGKINPCISATPQQGSQNTASQSIDKRFTDCLL